MVDIGAPFQALLPQLAFEGATKRNRPDIKPGDVVYARVTLAQRDMEPQLSCVDAMGRASGFGQLKGGVVLQVSTSYARSLLGKPLHPVLAQLGGALQFELAVGMNGRVWVSSEANPPAVVTVANAIQASEFLTQTQIETLVNRLTSSVM